MNLYIISFLMLLTQHSADIQQKRGYTLPAAWTKDFIISLSSGGGMQDVATEITFTYDSCRHVERTGTIKKITGFAMTASGRAEILRKMRELKVEKIRTVTSPGVTLDKGTDDICFQEKSTLYCVSDGSSSEIQQEDRPNFFGAYRYLVEFASRKK
jgi:hypothetical protein